MESFITIEELRKLNDEQLINQVSKLSFLDGSSNKENIKEIFEFLYFRRIFPIDFFIYFLNTNNIHLNETQYLRDLIACDFYEKNLIQFSLKFNPSNEIKSSLNLLMTQNPQDFSFNNISNNWIRFKMFSDFFNENNVDSLDDNYKFLTNKSDFFSLLNLIENIIKDNEKFFFNDKTLFLILKLKRFLKEKILIKISYSYCTYTVKQLITNFGIDSINLMKKLINDNKINAIVEDEIIHFN